MMPELSMRSAAASAIAFEAIGPTHLVHVPQEYWESHREYPTAGKVNAYAVDPNDAKIVYVASGRGTGLESYSSAGVYRTTDGGATWAPIDRGLIDDSGFTSSTINALWMDPQHSSTLLAASEYDGLYRTEDGGNSWRRVFRTTRATEFTSYHSTIYAASATGVLASSDEGRTWRVSLKATARRQPTAIASVEGSSGQALYAGMSDGSIYNAANGKWTYVGTLPYIKYPYGYGQTPEVHQIAIDPLQTSTVYALSNDGAWDQAMDASTDGGRSWVAVTQKRRFLWNGMQTIAFSAVHPHRVYLGEDGAFYYFAAHGSADQVVFQAAPLKVLDIRDVWVKPNGTDDACWIASDQGLDYTPSCSDSANRFQDTVVSAGMNVGLTRHVAVSRDGQTVVTSLQDFGGFVSSDAGKTWTTRADLYEDGFAEINPVNPRVCYWLDDADIRISTDGCRSYRLTSAGYLGYRLFKSIPTTVTI
jgi:photosystem II stability/assembly factor-like uncharacterized protein